MTTLSIALLALDWGSSQVRAFALGARGEVLDQRSSHDGASRLQGGAPAFEAALHRLAGDWLRPGLPVLACGMVGSAHGWCEAPYVASPVGLDTLHRCLVKVQASDGLWVHIVPGVTGRSATGLPDVMRGEETQLVGLVSLRPALAERATVVMPGTHSKWAQLQAGQLQSFSTRMTGELFALLREHSVLARLMTPSEDFDGAAFDRGVAVARQSQGQDLGRLLFSVRALGLFGELAAASAADYLSGLLIGNELASALGCGDFGPTAPTGPGFDPDSDPIALVGEPALCERYGRALAMCGRPAERIEQPLAAAGLWRLGQAAGLC